MSHINTVTHHCDPNTKLLCPRHFCLSEPQPCPQSPAPLLPVMCHMHRSWPVRHVIAHYHDINQSCKSLSPQRDFASGQRGQHHKIRPRKQHVCGRWESCCTGMCSQRARSITLYTLLEIPMTARTEDVRSAYRRLARQWHPDRHKGDDVAKQRFQQIQEAYEVLIDSRRRQTYDLRLVHLLNVEDYLERFKELILTASGLDMQPARSPQPLPLGPDRRQLLLTAA